MKNHETEFIDAVATISTIIGISERMLARHKTTNGIHISSIIMVAPIVNATATNGVTVKEMIDRTNGQNKLVKAVATGRGGKGIPENMDTGREAMVGMRTPMGSVVGTDFHGHFTEINRIDMQMEQLNTVAAVNRGEGIDIDKIANRVARDRRKSAERIGRTLTDSSIMLVEIRRTDSEVENHQAVAASKKRGISMHIMIMPDRKNHVRASPIGRTGIDEIVPNDSVGCTNISYASDHNGIKNREFKTINTVAAVDREKRVVEDITARRVMVEMTTVPIPYGVGTNRMPLDDVVCRMNIQTKTDQTITPTGRDKRVSNIVNTRRIKMIAVRTYPIILVLTNGIVNQDSIGRTDLDNQT